MRLEFADERINEFSEGGMHFINDFEHHAHGFDVSASVAEDLLKRTHFLDGEMVPIFKVSGAQPEVDGSDLTGEDAYPEGFPAADKLIDAGFKHSDISAMTREQLIDIKGIGASTADAILAALGE